jgi:hypothetical protein
VPKCRSHGQQSPRYYQFQEPFTVARSQQDYCTGRPHTGRPARQAPHQHHTHQVCRPLLPLHARSSSSELTDTALWLQTLCTRADTRSGATQCPEYYGRTLWSDACPATTQVCARSHPLSSSQSGAPNPYPAKMNALLLLSLDRQCHCGRGEHVYM